jgi:hypothetical protein
MSKAQLEAAQRLAAITGRPLSDFFKMPSEVHVQKVERLDICSCGRPWNEYGVCDGHDEENQQEKEERLEAQKSILPSQTAQDIREVGSSGSKQTDEVLGEQQTTDENITKYAKEYGGRIFKGRIHGGRDMSRVEYNKIKKEIKTVEEFWKHPLLYKMFRAEGQVDANFVTWTTSIEKQIESKYGKAN